MKTSKAALQNSAKEQCGVWLDTVQLKGKAKQKRLAQPISKLLNPFTEGGGYSLSVALNFTQTKMKMPKTKQSAISAFFTSHRRVLNKMSTTEEPNLDAVQPFSSSTSPAHTTAAFGKKRGRDMCLENSDLYTSEPNVDLEWIETEPMLGQKEAVSHSPLHNMYCDYEEKSEECKLPLSKRRLTDSSLPSDRQTPLQVWSQDPLLTWSQYTESEPCPSDQKYTTGKELSSSDTSFLNSLHSEEAFGNLMDVEGRTSTQKSFKDPQSSEMDDDKENSGSLSSNSPRKHSSFIWTEPKPAPPRKHKYEEWKRAGNEESLNSQMKWTKPHCSSFKKQEPQQQSGDIDENSLATLFTQDSEGFRVIAHRGLQARSPLKDQSNRSPAMVKPSVCRSLVEEEEEDDMLFTQDSQGNVVIKH